MLNRGGISYNAQESPPTPQINEERNKELFQKVEELTKLKDFFIEIILGIYNIIELFMGYLVIICGNIYFLKIWINYL